MFAKRRSSRPRSYQLSTLGHLGCCEGGRQIRYIVLTRYVLTNLAKEKDFKLGQPSNRKNGTRISIVY